ncbi:MULTISPECIES: ribose ABC transporter permease [unclassified Lentimonas]|uniref:ribose ABC transporter permease n=1 Tax=unclassified Lentimonas TaxID=2630993 RepID=UPI001327565C|nr:MULTISPECIES: ribose ABC transporter permease [unclassified Lentimonas]CAA6678592.1 Unannotated [Lentimonas sp. CC4]CAA6685824.1 Unannotated [Lentimonas sp. CC6]CAA7076298.1 Unannotated [Lentimonas sp. CC4]CAA7171964.1 Unannotated [Lentimonas sp. CC21]CAA7181553.1 Unannotated [Lentimonas sp. CC8]
MNKVLKGFLASKPLIGLVVFSIVVALLNPGFLTTDNLLNVLRQTSINAIIAIGMTYVILSAGIDLSVGSVLAFTGAVAAALLAAGVPLPLVIILPLLLGALLGAVSGALVGYGKLQPFITTLVAMTFLRGATLVFTDGKPISIAGDNVALMNFIGSGSLLGIPVTVLIMLLAMIAAYFSLNHTRFGRHVYAVGGNEEATRLSGINTNRVKVMVYAVSGMLAALAGIILTARLGTASPTAGMAYELDAIAAVVLGGTSLVGGSGRISGTLIGALIIGVLANALNLMGVSSNYQMMIKAIVILAAVLADRQGGILLISGKVKAMLGATVGLLLILVVVFFRGGSDAQIGLVISTQNNPFFVSLKEGAIAEAERAGVGIVVLNSQDDPVKERANVEDLLVRGVKVILINPVNSDAVGQSIKLANARQVAVVTLDRAAGSGEVTSHIASDNAAGGTMAAEYMVAELGRGAKVAELQGLAGTDAARDRGNGFHAIADSQLDIKISLAADFDRSKGYNTMTDIMQAQPDLQGVFAHNDEMALGALKAIEESGKDILVVGFDANEDAVHMVESGAMGATIAQQPELIGETGVITALKIINEEKDIPTSSPVELQIIKR